MSKGKPIRSPEQMPHKIVCKDIKGRNFTDATEHSWWYKGAEPNPANEREQKAMEKMFKIRDLILKFGGEQVCLDLYDEDADKIMERGQLFYGRGAKTMIGRPSQCHSNSAALWEANKGKCRIATGYALSDDGIWRQHTWVVQEMPRSWRIWETTAKRVAYFGYILSEEECQEFSDSNW